MLYTKQPIRFVVAGRISIKFKICDLTDHASLRDQTKWRIKRTGGIKN